MARKAKSFKRIIKDLDMFGYPVAKSLNFEGKGNTHKTCCGAWFSIFYYVLITVMICIIYAVMVREEHTQFNQFEFGLK